MSEESSASDTLSDSDDPLLAAMLAEPSGARFVRADFHIHTTASHDVTDPTLVPSQIVARARSEELSVIAITDHDGPGPFAEAIAAGDAVGILVLPGVEISTGGGHVLALFDPAQAPQISVLLAKLNVRDLGGGLRGTDESIVRTLEQVDSLGGMPFSPTSTNRRASKALTAAPRLGGWCCTAVPSPDSSWH